MKKYTEWQTLARMSRHVRENGAPNATKYAKEERKCTTYKINIHLQNATTIQNVQLHKLIHINIIIPFK